MIKTNFRLKDCFLTMMCFSIILFNGCILSPYPNSQTLSKQKKFVDQEEIKNDVPSAKIDKPLIEENKTINPPTTEQGSGYLSDGSALSMGVMDGDDELKVLQKIKRLEARLEKEKNSVTTLNDKLSELQTAKEVVENDFADTKKKLEEKNTELLDIIKSLELKLKEAETRTTTAEQEFAAVKKELLKAQIVETKAQQELYKLKIDNLKEDKE
jgi:hypothetical protein